MRSSIKCLLCVALPFATSCWHTVRKDEVAAWFSGVKVGDPIQSAIAVMNQKSIPVQDLPAAPPAEPLRIVCGYINDSHSDHSVEVYFKVDPAGRIAAIQFSEGDRGM
jgi:hypothetical protein